MYVRSLFLTFILLYQLLYVPLHYIKFFPHCVSLLCSRFTSSISFTTSFKTTYSLPSIFFFVFFILLIPISFISTCCARMCFKNLFQFTTNKKHWSQLAEEWRMEVEEKRREEKINKMLNGAQEVFALLLPSPPPHDALRLSS